LAKLIVRHVDGSQVPQFHILRQSDGKDVGPLVVPSPKGFPIEGLPHSDLLKELRWYRHPLAMRVVLSRLSENSPAQLLKTLTENLQQFVGQDSESAKLFATLRFVSDGLPADLRSWGKPNDSGTLFHRVRPSFQLRFKFGLCAAFDPPLVFDWQLCLLSSEQYDSF
jgi:hypothetical protein